MTSSHRHRIPTARILASRSRGRPVALVVHPGSDAREEVASLLKRIGFAVSRVPSLARAWARVDEQEGPVDLLVVGAALPEWEGDFLAHALRHRFPALAVVRLGADGPDEPRPHPLRDRPAVVVEAPYTLTGLAQGVGMALRMCPRPRTPDPEDGPAPGEGLPPGVAAF